MTDTRIYKLDRGMSIWFWLCPDCLKEKLSKGWALLEKRDAPHRLPCDECKHKAKKGLM